MTGALINQRKASGRAKPLNLKTGYIAGTFPMVFMILLAVSDIPALNGERLISFDEKGYTFSLWFRCSLNRDTLLNVLYDHSHLSKYTDDAGHATVLKEENNYYEMEVSYSYMFYSTRSVLRRTRIPENGTVIVDMLQFWHNRNLVPRMIDSHAEYRLVAGNGHIQVEYVQSAAFDEPLNWVYAKILKSRLNDFADNLIRYVDKLAIDSRKADLGF